jgi:hypothetical protein
MLFYSLIPELQRKDCVEQVYPQERYYSFTFQIIKIQSLVFLQFSPKNGEW